MNKSWRLPATRQAGFTLVEILVALTILGIVAMTFASIINNGALQSVYNNQKNTAVALAQEKMEEIKSVMPAQPADFATNVEVKFPDNYSSDVATPPSYGTGTESLVRNGITYTRVWHWQTLQQSTTTGSTMQSLFRVDVTVTWTYKTNYSSSQHSVVQTTYVTGR